MNGYKNDLKSVDQVGKMNFSGNITPMQWYKTIVYENGKPDLNAIIILSDIVYWFRPIEVRDEHTGAVIETRKKFKSDKLQRSYSAFSDMYGLTKNQVKAGIKKLCDLGIIEIELRTVHYNDVVANNVLFIDLIPMQLESYTYAILIDPLPNLNCIGPQLELDTNTEITQETTIENTQNKKQEQESSGGKNIFEIYESNIGVLTPMIADELRLIEKEFPAGWFEKAVKVSVNANKRKLSYVKGILRRWQEDGLPDDNPAQKKQKNIDVFLGSRYEQKQ